MKRIDDLKKLMKLISKSGTTLIVLKVLVIVLLGISYKNTIELLSPWVILLGFAALVYILIELFQHKFYQSFPVSLVECIENEVKSDTFKNDYARTVQINSSISECLIALNTQTCTLSNDQSYFVSEIENNILCDNNLEDGLKQLLQPLINNMQQITRVFNSETTIALSLRGMPQDWREDKLPCTISETAVIRDDNNIWKSILHELLEDNAQPKHWKLQIRQIIQSCDSNNHFQKAIVECGKDVFSIFVNPIPIVCDEELVQGCLIIIMKGAQTPPDDLKDVLSIYCRIISNWVAKYTDCFYRQIKEVSETIELEDEVLELYSDYSYKYRVKAPSEAVIQN